MDQIKILKTFFRKHIDHELVTRNWGNDDVITAKAAFVDAPIYCYFKKAHTENDEMIGCDSENYKYQWINFTCAKLKHPPKGVWYCKECKKQKKMYQKTAVFFPNYIISNINNYARPRGRLC